MSRLIRIDDFPYGRPTFHSSTSMEIVSTIAEIFNRHEVSFILGITSMYVSPAELQQLREVLLPHGCGVLHGFTHGFDRDWSTVRTLWETGGEFSGMSAKQIGRLYHWSHGYFQRWLGEAYDEREFILPFNCYTQEFLDALLDTPVKRIHTCDKEYKAYQYAGLNHGSLDPVISKYHITYHDVHKIDLTNPAQITLHWMFDAKRQGWQGRYEQFAKAVK